VGTPAITTRGYQEADVVELTQWICDVLDAPNDEAVIARVREQVTAQCHKFPVYG
jgi:glycine hydroxymethyltransferase